MPSIDIREVLLNIHAHYEDPGHAFSQIEKQMLELRREVDATNGSFKDQLDLLKKQASAKINSKNLKLSPEFDRKPFDSFIAETEKVQRELDKINRRKLTVDPTIRFRAGAASADLEDRVNAAKSATNQLRQLYDDDLKAFQNIERLKNLVASSNAGQRVQIEGAIQREIENIQNRHSQRPGLVSDIAALARGADSSVKSTERAARSAESWGERLDSLGARVKSFVPLLRGLGIILGVTLVSAIGALVGSLTAAVGGLAGLATALAAALGPAVALFVGFVSRLTSVLQVLQQHQLAIKASSKPIANQGRISLQQAERIRNANNQVKASDEAVLAAEQSLADARVAHARAAADAAQQVKDAYVNAYREMADAVERVKDAELGLEEAKLGKEHAVLNLKRAKLELKQFRDDIGATGKAFDNTFKKFTDVSFHPQDAAGLLQKQNVNLTAQQNLDLQEKVLAVKDARLGEKTATDAVHDSIVELTRSQQDLVKWQQKGIQASDQLTAALRAQQDAARDHSVADAQKNLASAVQSQAEAQHDLQAAHKKSAFALGGSNAAIVEYNRLLKLLSPAEKNFVLSLIALRKGFIDLVRKGTDPIFNAISSLMGRFKIAGVFIAGFLGQLGQDVGKNLQNLGKELTSPTSFAAFEQLAGPIRQILNLLGGPILLNSFKIFRSLALLFMPALLDAFKGIAKWTGKFANNLGGLKSDSKTVKLMVDSFNTWIRAIGHVIDLFVAFAGVVAPFGNDFLDFLSKGVASFTHYLRTAEGQKRVAQFFRDTLPLAKALITFLVKLGGALLKAFEFFAPMITDTINGLNVFLDIINFLEDILLKIPAPIREIIGLFLPLGGILRGGIDAVTISFKGMNVALGVIRATLRLIGALSTGLATTIVKGIKGTLGFLFGIGKTIASAIWSGIKFIFTTEVKIAQFLFGLIKAYVGILGSIGKFIAHSIMGPFKSVFRGIADFIAGVFAGVVNTVIGMINDVTSLINSITPGKIKVLGKTIFGGFPDIPKIPPLSRGGGSHIPVGLHEDGGIATRATLGVFGEAGSEALIPLNQATMAKLARAITMQMPNFSSSLTGLNLRQMERRPPTQIILNTPAGANPDARMVVSQIGQLLDARGLGEAV